MARINLSGFHSSLYLFIDQRYLLHCYTPLTEFFFFFFCWPKINNNLIIIVPEEERSNIVFLEINVYIVIGRQMYVYTVKHVDEIGLNVCLDSHIRKIENYSLNVGRLHKRYIYVRNRC